MAIIVVMPVILCVVIVVVIMNVVGIAVVAVVVVVVRWRNVESLFVTSIWSYSCNESSVCTVILRAAS